MAAFKLTLEYDGTGFAGWQRQAGDERTVQGTLERVVGEVCGEAPQVTGAGRTDAGVHALGQVAAVSVPTRLGAGELQRALNARLPKDLAVVACEDAPRDFHPRYDARSKLYRYVVWNGRARSPLRERTAHWVPVPLDVEAMGQAAGALEGHHDFASFKAAGSDVEDTVRTLHRAEVTGGPGGEVRLELEGSGFLRHMVRNVAGTLIEVGLGKRPPEGISGLLEARDRTLAGPTAPARGLTLVWVSYAFPRNPEDLPPEALDGPGPLG